MQKIKLNYHKKVKDLEWPKKFLKKNKVGGLNTISLHELLQASEIMTVWNWHQERKLD